MPDDQWIDDVYPQWKALVDAAWDAISGLDETGKLCVLGICTSTVLQRMAPGRQARQFGSFVMRLAADLDNEDGEQDEETNDG